MISESKIKEILEEHPGAVRVATAESENLRAICELTVRIVSMMVDQLKKNEILIIEEVASGVFDKLIDIAQSRNVPGLGQIFSGSVSVNGSHGGTD